MYSGLNGEPYKMQVYELISGSCESAFGCKPYEVKDFEWRKLSWNALAGSRCSPTYLMHSTLTS